MTVMHVLPRIDKNFVIHVCFFIISVFQNLSRRLDIYTYIDYSPSAFFFLSSCVMLFWKESRKLFIDFHFISFSICSASVLFLLYTQNKHAKKEKMRKLEIKTRRREKIPIISFFCYLTKRRNVDEDNKTNKKWSLT